MVDSNAQNQKSVTDRNYLISLTIGSTIFQWFQRKQTCLESS